MASDGLKTQWRLDRYTGLLDRHPSLIAGILYRDYSRGSDDATVVRLTPAMSATTKSHRLISLELQH